jgi:hypothetical protein
MAKLILTAENFAFGPIGKLLDIVDFLKKQGHNLTFVGFGTSYQLAKSYPFDAIYEIDTDNPKSKIKLQKIISKADMLVSSMDIPSILIAKQQGILTTWIDCLFWFWSSIPEEVLNVDLYIRERLMDDIKNENKYKEKMKNLFTVGPIIGKMNRLRRKNQVLISFGGGEAPYWYKVGRDTNYPRVMTKILQDYVNWEKFDRIIVASSENIIKNLIKYFPSSLFEFTVLSHDKFLTELSCSDIALITPGLVTAELSFEHGIPTIFLPPSNNSQYLQLDQFVQHNLAPAHVHLSDIMPKLMFSDISPRDSIELVLKQLRKLECSSDMQREIGKKINELIQNKNLWSKEFVYKGKQFIRDMGGNGAKSATDKINQILIKNGFK